MNSLTRACCSLLLAFTSTSAAADIKYFQYDKDADTGAATLYELAQAWVVRQFLKENAHDDKINAHVRLSTAIDIAEAAVVIQEEPSGTQVVYFCNKPGQTTGEVENCKGQLWSAPIVPARLSRHPLLESES